METIGICIQKLNDRIAGVMPIEAEELKKGRK
jgi:hypothetical protein